MPPLSRTRERWIRQGPVGGSASCQATGAGGPYPPEFKREAVELYRRSDKSIAVVASELGIATESLRAWNKQHAVDCGEREGLSTPEREELRELKRKLLRVEQERDLLKRAAAFFARETEIR